jgi:predicted metal-dependent hydrolase
MVQKTVWLPEVGELTLSKRRGSKNIRLSVTAAGKVRVGLPAWAPYSMGISFAKKRADWIHEHLSQHPKQDISDGDRIGKSFRLAYRYDPGAKSTSTRLRANAVVITSNLALHLPEVQKKAAAAAERALKKEAEALLPQRLEGLAARHGFKFRSVRIKKLVSRWGSCSNRQDITLNYFLMQLPWALIDYVIIHELVHTKHLNHSSRFWEDFDAVYPGAKQFRKQIREYRPVLNSLAVSVA